ncbi:MAG: tetratricopeptide repeat protein [Sphingobacteriia bacterium]|nr:tetratricopeptide repeat protein [Sphingobacteriia bacterium]
MLTKDNQDLKHDIILTAHGLYKSRLYNEALTIYEQILKIKPTLSEAWNGKGNCLYYLKRYEEAESCFDKVLENGTNSINALSGKGIICLKKKEYSKSIEYFNEVLKLNPNNGKIWSIRAKIFILYIYREFTNTLNEQEISHLKKIKLAFTQNNTYALIENYSKVLNEKNYLGRLICFEYLSVLSPTSEKYSNEYLKNLIIVDPILAKQVCLKFLSSDSYMYNEIAVSYLKKFLLESKGKHEVKSLFLSSLTYILNHHHALNNLFPNKMTLYEKALIEGVFNGLIIKELCNTINFPQKDSINIRAQNLKESGYGHRWSNNRIL